VLSKLRGKIKQASVISTSLRLCESWQHLLCRAHYVWLFHGDLSDDEVVRVYAMKAYKGLEV